MVRNAIRNRCNSGAVRGAVCLPLGCRKKAYENPITKDTQQPDKVLFDTAIDDIEHGRYERARLTLQTLMNTYDTSEYLAKAKLAVADSWYPRRRRARLRAGRSRVQGLHPVLSADGRGRRSAGKDLQDAVPADGQGGSRPHARLRAQDECRQVLTAVPQQQVRSRRRSSSCATSRKCWPTRSISVGDFYHNKGQLSRPRPTGCRR